jgi:hypothetical protein
VVDGEILWHNPPIAYLNSEFTKYSSLGTLVFRLFNRLRVMAPNDVRGQCWHAETTSQVCKS